MFAAGAILLAYSKDALDRKSLKISLKIRQTHYDGIYDPHRHLFSRSSLEGMRDELVQSYLTAVPRNIWNSFGCDDCDVYPWLRSGFYRNYIRCGADCCPDNSSAWCRPNMAWNNDCH